MNSRSSIQKIYIRSGYLGDLLVCLPYIIFDITKNQIPIENIGFIILQKKKISKTKIQLETYNTIKLIFGDSHPFSNKTKVIQNFSIDGLLKARKDYKSIFKYPQYEYLPFTKESKFKLKIKKILFKILGINCNVSDTNLKYDFNKNEYNHFFKNEFDFETGKYLLQNSSEFLGVCQLDSLKHEKYILVYPNAQLDLKKWPIDNYIEIISYFSNILKFKVYLIGGQSDMNYNNIVLGSLNLIDNSSVVNLAGKLSIRENIELAKNATLFIGNDGGPMHMAAIFGTPIIAIFSFREEIGIWDPVLSSSYILIRGNVGCKICNLSFCTNNCCITKVKTHHIIDAYSCIINKDKKYKSNWVI